MVVAAAAAAAAAAAVTAAAAAAATAAGTAAAGKCIGGHRPHVVARRWASTMMPSILARASNSAPCGPKRLSNQRDAARRAQLETPCRCVLTQSVLLRIRCERLRLTEISRGGVLGTAIVSKQTFETKSMFKALFT